MPDESIPYYIMKNKNDQQSQRNIKPKHTGPCMAIPAEISHPDEILEVGRHASHYQCIK